MSDSNRPDNQPVDKLASSHAASPLSARDAEPETTRVLDVPIIPTLSTLSNPSQNAHGDADVPLEGSDAEAYEALKKKRAERRRKKLIRRGIIAGVVVGVLVVGGIAVSLMNQQPETTMDTITDMAMQGSFTKQVDASGTLQPLSSTVVAPEIDGQIETVNVNAGQYVNEGDTLFTIKNNSLDRDVAQAERALKAAKQSLALAQQMPATPVADPETGDPTGAYDTSERDSAILSATTEVESAQEAYDLSVSRAAQRTVKAPCSGSIVALNAQPGANLSDLAAGGSSNGPLVQIADLSKMKVTVQVGEEDIASVAVDQTGDITFPAFEDLTLEGRVTGIASIATGSSESYYGDGSSPTFAVDILIDAPDARLKPGMTADVSIITESYDNVVMVPLSALLSDDGETHYVNVMTDPETEEMERVEVTVYAQNDDYAVVGKPKDAPADENPDLKEAPIADGDILVIAGGMMGDDDIDAGFTSEVAVM
ncbi:efflux RND transporter periplasmic adaptor subunit [Collinsella provencensis]|uniref:efflux RND transporter periplasmic adaptor subunit n=1 Tax=Collinsella provencensis TaxID=1937461 RepID=UPI000C8213DA|nr:efflux RND transporter periplasmic adaptor subunit [Collinsella provencensis]